MAPGWRYNQDEFWWRLVEGGLHGIGEWGGVFGDHGSYPSFIEFQATLNQVALSRLQRSHLFF